MSKVTEKSFYPRSAGVAATKVFNLVFIRSSSALHPPEVCMSDNAVTVQGILAVTHRKRNGILHPTAIVAQDAMSFPLNLLVRKFT